MFTRIINNKCTGKTDLLMEIVNANSGIMVCKNPQHFMEKASLKGYNNIKFISYNEFIKECGMLDKNFYIDELEDFVRYYFDFYRGCYGSDHEFMGYTLSRE